MHQGKSTTSDSGDDGFLPLPLQIAHGMMEQVVPHGKKYAKRIAVDFNRLVDDMPDDDGSGSPD